jgi:hypothetical protein
LPHPNWLKRIVAEFVCEYEDCVFVALVLIFLLYGIKDCQKGIAKLIPAAFLFLVMDFMDV